MYAYEVFYNAPKKKLEKKLVDLSILQRKVAEPPLSRAALIRRVESDVALFQKALQSDGYYAYTVEQKIDFANAPVAITFDIALQALGTHLGNTGSTMTTRTHRAFLRT